MMVHMRNVIKQYNLICMLFLLLFLTVINIQIANGEKADDNVAGYNKLRIEQEDKLLVPLDKTDEVWKFLYERFIVDTESLKKLDASFTSSFNEEQFTDTYFDTPDLKLLSTQSGVRYRRRVNLTNPEDEKSGRELMQIKMNDISQNVLERGEIKFKIKHPTKKDSPEDRHPMLGIVKPSQRDDFKQRLKALGLEPFSMQPILTVEDFRRRIYINREGKPFMSLSLDVASSNIWWAKTKFVEIEPELNEIAFTEANQETKKYMETILHKSITEIKQQFPYVETNLTPKYCKSFYYLEAQLPFLRFLVRWNLHSIRTVLTIMIIALAVMGFFIYFIVHTRNQRKA